MISHSFPPSSQVGGKRAVAFCRYLPEHQIQPIVLTVQEKYISGGGESVPLPEKIKVLRAKPMADPIKGYKKLRDVLKSENNEVQGAMIRVTGESPKKRRGSLTSFALGLLDSYYRYWRWHVFPVRAGARLVMREPIAAIFSSGPPWSSHLVALRLKRKYSVPWIADFRDGWAANDWGLEEIPIWQNLMDRKLEKICVQSADQVVSVTNPLREYFVRSYPNLPKSKFVVLPNGFDDPEPCEPDLKDASPSLGSEDGIRGRRPKFLLHLGDLYFHRRIDSFCLAVADLLKSGELESGAIRVLFQGDASPEIIAAAERAAPELFREKIIEVRRRIPWGEAHQLLDGASLLLIFQGDNRNAIPAKFFEYLRTGKPILAVVQRGALTEIIESTRCGVWADPRDPSKIAAKLLEALALPERSPTEVEHSAGQYHYRLLSARLAEWIHTLVLEEGGLSS